MGPIGSLFGVGDTSAPDVGQSSNSALGLMQALIAMQPSAFGTQSKYGPAYTNLTAGETGTAAGDLASMLAAYMPGLNASINNANAGTAAANVGNAGNLGAAAAAAIGKTNPAEANMLSSLNDTAGSALAAGTTLAPSDETQIVNNVQSNWASRGLGGSSPAELDQALQLYTGGQSVLNQREQEAGSVASLDNQLVTSPALSLTQAQSTAPLLTSSVLGQGQSIAGPSGNTLTDPTSILSAAYNAQAASQITSANNQAALNSY